MVAQAKVSDAHISRLESTTKKKTRSVSSKKEDDAFESPPIERKHRKPKSSNPLAEAIGIVPFLDGDDEDGPKEKSSGNLPKRRSSRVSFEDSKNKKIEVPRISKKYIKKCWFSAEEIQQNMMMQKIRRMVHEKLLKNLPEKDEYFIYDDVSDTEYESEEFGDSWHSQESKQSSHDEQEKSHGDHVEPELLEPKGKELLLTKKGARILEHLIEAVMDRPKEEIYSFLTSKCTISFTKKRQNS